MKEYNLHNEDWEQCSNKQESYDDRLIDLCIDIADEINLDYDDELVMQLAEERIEQEIADNEETKEYYRDYAMC